MIVILQWHWFSYRPLQLLLLISKRFIIIIIVIEMIVIHHRPRRQLRQLFTILIMILIILINLIIFATIPPRQLPHHRYQLLKPILIHYSQSLHLLIYYPPLQLYHLIHL